MQRPNRQRLRRRPRPASPAPADGPGAVVLMSVVVAALCALTTTPSCTLDRLGTNPTLGGGGSGGGSGLPCDSPDDCPGVDTACKRRNCAAGECGMNYFPGAECDEEGGRYCDTIGHCVECTEDAHCEPLVCNDGQCVAQECRDGVLNGDETDIDCGGSCAPCANGQACIEPSDCQSGFCDPSNVCAPCSTHADCPGQYCEPTTGECTDRKVDGESCLAPEECASGFCPAPENLCCNSLCDGLCLACSFDRTDQPNGACAPVKVDTDPEGECAENLPCALGTCDGQATPGCLYADTSTTCGSSPSCINGVETLQDYCDGAGACHDNGMSDCYPRICSGSQCATGCSGDGECAGDHWCDGSDCQADQGLGGSCNRDAQCIDNEDCEDSFCCDQPCTGACLNCSSNPGYCAGNTCTCTEQYGGLPGYHYCGQPSGNCEFYAWPDSSGPARSCDYLCESRGGRCVDAYEENNGTYCSHEYQVSCGNARNSLICICTSGCNGGPRCPPGDTCTGSGCP